MMQLTQKVVVITGASKGIGAATARHFAAQGAMVVLLARDGNLIDALRDEIGTNALAIRCDVSRYADVAAAIEQARAAFGRIDVLVNNAGVMGPMRPMAETDPDEWGFTADVNLKGVFFGMRAALPVMLEQGGGTILTVSSGAAHRPVQGWSAYCASKAGAAMLTRSLHLEYAASGIRALGLSPGTVATDMQRDIKKSGVGPVAQLDWSDHIPADWPARALAWMCGTEADRFAGEEISLRDPQMRTLIGLG
jgi:NAD(P)-dependent dehydrogenase (short-subunit alcohol dehydrogenase family)